MSTNSPETTKGTDDTKKRNPSKESKESELDNDLPTPPDGGWGIVVVAASFIIHIIADGVAYSFGVFLVAFLEYFPGSGRGELGWINSLMVGVTLGSGPIASAFTNKYGCRPVTIVGAIIAAIGFIISIFAMNVFYLYVSYGIITGFGLGLIYLPAIVSVTYYFEKHRSFATGIAVCGSGIGTFIFAPLTKFLLDQFGWKGATLIEAGLILNCVICGALFRPLEPTKKKRPLAELGEDGDNGHIGNGNVPSPGDENQDPVPGFKVNGDLAPQLSASVHSLPHHFNKNLSVEGGHDVKQFTSDMNIHRLKSGATAEDKKKHAEKLKSPMVRKDILYSGSLANIPMYRSNPNMFHQSVCSLNENEMPNIEETKSDCCPKECQQLIDFSLLKDPLFLLFSLSNFFTSIGFNTPYIFLPDRAIHIGVPEDQAAFLISIIGIANTVGRVVFGFLSDRKFVNRLMLYSTALTLCGICTALSAFAPSYGWLAAYATSYGLFIGVYVSLTSVVLVDLLGLDRLTSAFGLLLLFQGIATIIGPPIAGWLRDGTGSYTWSFIIVGVAIAISGSMLFAIPCIRRYMERKHGVTQHDVDMGKIVECPENVPKITLNEDPVTSGEL